MAITTKNMKSGIDWFMVNMGLGITITSRPRALDITDRKPVIYAETQVPGLEYTPLNPFRFGNDNLTFSVPIIQRLKTQGNQSVLAAIELLRQQDRPFTQVFSRGLQFIGPPKVLYYWGTHRPPLIYVVKNASFQHRTQWTTKLGLSAFTVVDFELEVDAQSALYTAWQSELRVAALTALPQAVNDLAGDRSTRFY